MQAALADARRDLAKTYPLVIDGRAVTTADTFDSLNPSHIREVVGRCGRATPEQARQAIEAAQRAFPAWRDLPASERSALVRP